MALGSILKKLGILKDIKNASVWADAPKIFAKTTSRKKPEILDIKVIPPTTAEDFTSPFESFVSFSCSIYYV